MFRFFFKKTDKEKLISKHKKLLKEAYRLSSINRNLSDDKVLEADQLMRQIEQLD